MSRVLTLIIAVATVALLTPGALAQARGPSPSPSGCPSLDLAGLHAPSEIRSGLSESQLESKFLGPDGLAENGWRPTRLTGVLEGSQVRYATRWVHAAGPDTKVAPGLTGAQFHADYLANRANYRPIDVSGFNGPDGVLYNVVWERNTAGVGWLIHRDTTIDQLNKLVNQHRQDGYAPERIEGYRDSQGELRFITSWIHAPRCDWQLHPVMNIATYDATFDDYAPDGYRQLQVDATNWTNDLWYHGIWWRQPGPGYQVRVNKDWYLHQQIANNNWCDGYEFTNLYTADYFGGVRYGGIWTFDTWITIDDDSPLADQVYEEVNCAPGRGGTAIFNLTTGDEITVFGDMTFGMSSTAKALILYVLLARLQDDDMKQQGIGLSTLLELDEELGSNQGDQTDPDPLEVGDDETVEYLARIMIDHSNNWATNRLIQFIAEINDVSDEDHVMDPINDALEEFGLRHTRFNRYMTGDGSPSIHGGNALCDGACADYAGGYDNVTTPREFASFLRLMHENPGLLVPAMHDKFWELMGLNNDAHADALDEGIPDWAAEVDQATKGGSNKWGWDDEDPDDWTSWASPGDFAHRPQLGSHVQRSEVGRIEFDNNDQVVVYATFFNDAQDVPSYQPFVDALDCIQVDVVRAYSGATTGTVLPQCE